MKNRMLMPRKFPRQVQLDLEMKMKFICYDVIELWGPAYKEIRMVPR